MLRIEDPNMRLIAVIIVICILTFFLVIGFLSLPCSKEKYEILNKIPNIKNLYPKTIKCDKSNFSKVYANVAPNSGFENKYKIKSAEFPTSNGNPCPCYDWCYQNGNCKGFTYESNIKPNIDRCDFMSKEISIGDLRPMKDKVYYQKTKWQN
jgi:hypothetical protein